MNRQQGLWILTLIIFSTFVQARDLGSFGETFAIDEENLLSVITAKLDKLGQSNELEIHKKRIQAKMIARLQRPLEVEGLIRTKTPRIFSYDPSITVPYDLKDHRQKVFFKAGSQVNPLDTHSLRYALLFIDGDDKEQLNWAINHKTKTKIILVKGSPFALMKEHKVSLFFDQGGTLVRKFGIQQVPARITQEEKHLKIEEVLPDVPDEGGIS